MPNIRTEINDILQTSFCVRPNTRFHRNLSCSFGDRTSGQTEKELASGLTKASSFLSSDLV
jgi:hypothetical protein